MQNKRNRGYLKQLGGGILESVAPNEAEGGEVWKAKETPPNLMRFYDLVLVLSIREI
jgi:hypothetical protein